MTSPTTRHQPSTCRHDSAGRALLAVCRSPRATDRRRARGAEPRASPKRCSALRGCRFRSRSTFRRLKGVTTHERWRWLAPPPSIARQVTEPAFGTRARFYPEAALALRDSVRDSVWPASRTLRLNQVQAHNTFQLAGRQSRTDRGARAQPPDRTGPGAEGRFRYQSRDTRRRREPSPPPVRSRALRTAESRA